jgi:hypothetical protein
MILIGSKALEFYIPDLGRVTHDWDILCSDEEFDQFERAFAGAVVKTTDYSRLFEISGEVYELKNTSRYDPSDFALLAYQTNNERSTPFGKVRIPEFRALHAIKKATAEVLNEPNHKYDLELMEKSHLIEFPCEPLYKQRLKETQERVEKSRAVKKDFFHEYHIPEYIYHDELHEMIADLLDIKLATYVRTIDADVHRSEGLFDLLTHAQKISLMVEETLVLNLERWFIPQMVENGINYRLIEMFYNNNEGLPTYKILKHCNLTGLKGEAKWVTDFSKANFFEIEKEWQLAKKKIKDKGGFPSHFFERLFKLREEYKQGKQVDLGK